MRWNTILLVLFIPLIATTGTAIEGYDGPTGNDTMHIMGASQPSLVDVQVNSTDTRCGEGNTVENISIDRDDDTMTAVTFDGILSTSDPCQELSHIVDRENGSYLLTIDSTSTGDMCMQCLGEAGYDARLVFAGDIDLVVKHGDQQMATIETGDNSTAVSRSTRVSETPDPVDDERTAERSGEASAGLPEAFNTSIGRLKVSRQNSACMAGADEPGIVNTWVDETAAGFSLGVVGELETATPRSLVDASVSEEDGVVVIDLEEGPSQGIGTQCVGKVSYHIGGNVQEPFTLEIRHEGETVEEIERVQEQSFISDVFMFFAGLFS